MPNTQAFLLSPDKPSLRQFPPRRHHTQRTTQIEAALQATANRIERSVTWLSSAGEALTSPEVRSHTNMAFIIKEQKEALKRHQHLTKSSHSPNHTLGSVYPLVPSSLTSPNIPIRLKVPPASCQAAAPWMLQVLFVSGNKQWVIYSVDSLISPWWFWK